MLFSAGLVVSRRMSTNETCAAQLMLWSASTTWWAPPRVGRYIRSRQRAVWRRRVGTSEQISGVVNDDPTPQDPQAKGSIGPEHGSRAARAVEC
eukprot:scaffold67628_cov73-Phaeocystis_antarctica.AAC.4